MTKTANIFISDLHVGSTVGICAPKAMTDDGSVHKPGKISKWLYRRFIDFTEEVKDATAGWRRILYINGDAGELDSKGRSNQLWTHNPAHVLSALVDVLDPLLQLVDDVYVIRGTVAHVGKSAWVEEELARDIGAVPSGEAASWWHLRAVSEGVRLDVAHHGKAGYTPRTKANSVQAYAADITWYYMVEMGQQPPHLAVRSHVHRYNTSADNYPVEVITTPCWQGITEYGYRIAKENAPPDNGGVVVYCEDGEYTKRVYKYQMLRERRLWTMKV